MRVHQNQINQNAQLDAMYAAQKAEAKRAAERTRKKLFESASKLAGEAESEACVVELGAGEGSQENAAQPNGVLPRKPKKQLENANSADAGHSISDWA